MKKTEIISLLLIVAAVAGFVFAFQMEMGRLRELLGLLSMGLVIIAMDPTVHWRKKSSESNEINRVGRAITYALVCIVLVILLIAIEVKGWSFVFFTILFCAGLIVSVYSYYSPRGWLRRRLHWLAVDKNIKILETGKKRKKCFYTVEMDHNGLRYDYLPFEKKFHIYQTMYLNPRYYEKEYEERNCQLQKQIEQVHIPQVHCKTECDSNSSFSVSLRLQKRDATKENVCRIRDILKDLAKEDFNQHLFTRFVFDDDTVYLETYHYDIIRMMLVSAKGNVEHYNMQGPSYEPSERMDELYWEIDEDYLLYKLQPKDLIEAEEFERIWDSKSQEQVIDSIS